MSLPRPGSSYPGYYPNLPTRPPDMGEIKGEYIEDLEGIKFEPAEPPRSPEHVSRQQFLKQFPLISVRPPSPVPAPLGRRGV